MLKKTRDFLFISAGILSAGLGLKGFLLPNRFIDGGVTGISLLVSIVSKFDVSILLVIFNIPFIILGYSQISKAFAVKSALAIVGLAFCIHFINYPVITDDNLLISMFGGFFLGAGIGLAIRGGCVLDGTEVLAIYVSRKFDVSIGVTVLLINIFIFSVAAFMLSLETALYSVLIYLVASKTVDFIVQGIEEYIGLIIISEQHEQIRKVLTQELNRGATIFKGEGGLKGAGGQSVDINIIYSVVTRLETSKIKNEILDLDENAFIIEQSINQVKGGIVKKRPFH